jgi:hypothetical protein
MNVKSPSRKSLVGVILILTVLLAGCIVYYQQVIAGFEGAQESLPFYVGAPYPYEYIVDCNSTAFFYYNGTTGHLEATSTNDDNIIQWSIDNCTTSGGLVFVRRGSYSASVTLKDNVTLILDKGASTITVTIDSGATCQLIDFNARRTRWYESGVLKADYNHASGKITTDFGNFTTIYVTSIENATLGGNVQILRLIVENGTSFPASPSKNQVFLRTDHKVLYAYDGSDWVAVGFRDYANLTGTPDLSVYLLADASRPLTANWNVGNYGIYGVTWLNATDIKFTGSFWWGSYNRTDTLAYPEQTASYIVFQDGSYTKMKNGTTGQIDAYSTNASQIINWALGNLTSERTWYEKVMLKGNFTCDSPIQIGNWTELCGTAAIYMKAGTRTNIIQNLNRATGNHHIYIHDLTFYGLYSAYSGQGNAIDIYNTNYIAGGNYFDPNLILENLNFYRISNHSISLYNIASPHVSHIEVRTSEWGILLEKVVDGIFNDMTIYALDDHYALKLGSATSSNHFSDIYLGGAANAVNGALYLYNAVYNFFSNLRIDYSSQVGMELADSSNYNQFINFQISGLSLNANATYNAITITSGLYNVFVNGIITRKLEPNYANYAIQEIAPSNYNVLIGITAINCAKYGIVKVGANTQVHLCYNGTTWIS